MKITVDKTEYMCIGKQPITRENKWKNENI